jgi:phosphoribosylanthranilate isomerase
MMVKVCGITNREDALAAAEAGASALGFVFWPGSPRYIEPDRAADILAILPSTVSKVGLFVNEPPDAVANVAGHLGLDIVQIHGETPPPGKLRVWKALGVKPEFRPQQLDGYAAEAFVLDAPAGAAHGGTGKTYDWRLVAGIPKKVVLAGGLDAENVREAIRTARPWGVDASSRLESAPGRKDHKKMAAFIEAALSETP